MIACPELLLVCESRCGTDQESGSWRFALEQLDGSPYLDASDTEPGDANRLALLSVVRGLEALPGPSSVTMLSSSRYVIRSLSESLPRWRDAGFMWEHFGQRMEVTHADLWRRIDRALDIHAVSACCVAPAPNVRRHLGPQPLAPRSVASPQATSPRGERWSGVTDGLRRWLIGQCSAVAGGYAESSGRQLAVA